MAGAKSVILLVDDDGDFLAITRHILQAAGYDVVCCQDPADALGILDRQPCDLVITDLMMTCLDSGFSLAQKIKADPRRKGMPVIIATSARSTSGFDFRPRGREDLEHMHADAYFDKPLPRQLLIKTIEELVKTPSQGSTS